MITNNSFFCWGTGNYSKIAIEQISRQNIHIRGFCDSDKSKWGRLYYGCEVLSPEGLKKEVRENELVLILSAYAEQIYTNCKDLGISESVIRVWDLELEGAIEYSLFMERREAQRLVADISLKGGAGKRISMVYNTFCNYLDKRCWFRSITEATSIDEDGKVPWISYSAIDFLKKHVNKNMKVFEYGMGASTEWWANHVYEIVSIEHDYEWFNRIKSSIGKKDNVKLVFEKLDENGGYVNYIKQYEGSFDVVVIDGRKRVESAVNSLGALNKGGVILFDDSERPRYQEGLSFLKGNGFKELELWGTGPSKMTYGKTSIFYRDGNCLNI